MCVFLVPRNRYVICEMKCKVINIQIYIYIFMYLINVQ